MNARPRSTLLFLGSLLLLGAAIAGCGEAPSAPVTRPPQGTRGSSDGWPPASSFPFTTEPEPESYYGAMVRRGSTIYAIGGEGIDWSGSGKTRAYDPATKRWSEKAPLPSPRYGMAAIAMGDRIFLLGGTSPTDAGEEGGRHMARYDIAGDAWTPLPDIPFTAVAVTGWNQAALCAGRIYVASVPSRTDANDRKLALYSTADGIAWSAHRSELAWIHEGVLVSDDRRVYIIGRGANGTTAETLMYAFDPATGGYTRLAPPTHGYRGYLNNCYCRDGKIYKINSTAGSANVMEIYTIATDSWSEVAIPYPMTNNALFQPLVMDDATGEVYFCALPFSRRGVHFNPATLTFSTR